MNIVPFLLSASFSAGQCGTARNGVIILKGRGASKRKIYGKLGDEIQVWKKLRSGPLSSE
jgi:hypothetical protein